MDILVGPHQAKTVEYLHVRRAEGGRGHHVHHRITDPQTLLDRASGAKTSSRQVAVIGRWSRPSGRTPVKTCPLSCTTRWASRSMRANRKRATITTKTKLSIRCGWCSQMGRTWIGGVLITRQRPSTVLWSL